MTDTIETLAQRLSALEAREEIRELKARYLRACDLKDAAELRDTLMPDGALIAYEGFPPFADRESFIAVFEQMACVSGVHDMHHAMNAVVELTGPDEARGKWSLHFKSVIVAQKTIITMGVEYEDRYVRKDGRWWIAETRTTRPLCLIEQVGPEGQPTYVALGEAPAAYGEQG